MSDLAQKLVLSYTRERVLPNVRGHVGIYATGERCLFKDVTLLDFFFFKDATLLDFVVVVVVYLFMLLGQGGAGFVLVSFVTHGTPVECF